MPQICQAILACLLSIYSWSLPQPQYSEGLLVVYGNQCLVQDNANWHSYSLAPYQLGGTPATDDSCTPAPYDGCGFAAISPAMLGRVAWFRTEFSDWVGPCLGVDAVARRHAYESIYDRQEVAEVSREVAARLGFKWGAWGYVWFGPCPPPADSLFPRPALYAPPLVWDHPPDDGSKSFYPYPDPQQPAACP